MHRGAASCREVDSDDRALHRGASGRAVDSDDRALHRAIAWGAASESAVVELSDFTRLTPVERASAERHYNCTT